MDNSKPVSVPLGSHFKLSKKESPSTKEERAEMKKVPYASAIGSIMYAMVCTRPDIAQAVGVVSRFMGDPGKQHWEAVKWILRYLRGTTERVLCFNGKNVELAGYVDADLASNDLDGRRSTTGYVFTYGGTAISWTSKLQKTVALSTTEAEYVAATEASKEMVWLQSFLDELGKENKSSRLYSDSQSAIFLAKNPAFHSRTKHVELKYHYIRHLVEMKILQLEKILGSENPADMFTKIHFVSNWVNNSLCSFSFYIRDCLCLFPNIQAQFLQELKETSRWWENTGLVQELPFIRDRIVECYYWTTGVVERREHGFERIMLTKINALVTTIDDIYDIYGTLEELELFTEAIRRWDIESIDQLPPYMKVCYLALYNFVNEMGYYTLKDKGFNSIPFLRKTWVDLVETYLIEANWYHKGHKPSLEEYINNAWISIGGVPILSHLFFRLTDSIDEEDAESVHKYHDIVCASCTILRLADDMGTSLDEVERGDVPKSVQCYMNEYNASEEEARKHVQSLIEETWKTMNKEMMDSPFSVYFAEVCANLSRMAQFIYQKESDGFGMQHSFVNKQLRSLLFEPYE
ncbi:1,8-cineole synthase, chloroplastic-like [Salvia hispanica]|uniref:1,8-cineole synthase, chloroplastic-like n=1 Tax=Salvia hispanica TaxID=49212 RepID=UPI00200987C3|nr:1,8-cineole synthase, chloroplastic-like [Salvia hispanica]